MEGVEIQGLVKRYPRSTDLFHFLRRPWAREEVTALRGIDLRLEPGHIYGLVGPNGAGKTSLLKVLAGLVLPTEGSVRLDGVDALARPALIRERVGLVVADERSFYWRLGLRQNLEFFASLQHLRGRERDRRVRECLEMVGLGDQAERSFRELSTGMRQRLSIARGLLVAPPVLLLDEPTRSLDPVAARGVRELLRQLLESDPRRIAVFSSHQLSEVAELCSRVLVIRGGRLVAERDLAPGAGAVRPEVLLRVRGPLPEGVLAGLPEVQALGSGPSGLRLRLDRPEALDLVVDRLRARGVGIVALQPAEPTLEELLVDEQGGSG
jgi:ABC-2 type transport system ATP-binding protein